MEQCRITSPETSPLLPQSDPEDMDEIYIDAHHELVDKEARKWGQKYMMRTGLPVV